MARQRCMRDRNNKSRSLTNIKRSAKRLGLSTEGTKQQICNRITSHRRRQARSPRRARRSSSYKCMRNKRNEKRSNDRLRKIARALELKTSGTNQQVCNRITSYYRRSEPEVQEFVRKVTELYDTTSVGDLDEQHDEVSRLEEEMYRNMANEIVGPSVQRSLASRQPSPIRVDPVQRSLASRQPSPIRVGPSPSRVVGRSPTPALPEYSEDWKECNNQGSFVTLMDWDNEDQPNVSIIFKENERYHKFCFTLDEIQRLIDVKDDSGNPQYVMAEWEGADDDDMGYGGRPNWDKLVIALPDGIHYITADAFKLIQEQEHQFYYAVPKYNQPTPIGNLRGIFGVGNLHGQNPKWIYNLVPLD